MLKEIDKWSDNGENGEGGPGGEAWALEARAGIGSLECAWVRNWGIGKRQGH